eukprot:8803535-Heterocapsa_arctica.AAC.1
MRPTGKAWQNGGTDAMAATDKGKGQGKGREKGGSQSSDRSQLYMVYGKVTRNKLPCTYHAAGRCLKGAECPWSHTVSSETTVAAAPSNDRPVKRDKVASQAACHQWKQSGKCSFGADCSCSHDVVFDKKRSDKTPRNALAIEDKKQPGKSDQVRKHNNTAAMAEAASESEHLEEEESEEA